jgi:uncharacterized membrane protein YqjE
MSMKIVIVIAFISTKRSAIFSGCCVVFVAVLGKAALGSMQQSQEDKFSRIKSVNQLAATTEEEEKAARWWAVVLSSLVSMVQATLVHHLPLLACIVLFISGKRKHNDC